MRTLMVLVCLTLAANASVVRADWDPVLEAKEEAAREAARAAQAKREAQMNAFRHETEVKAQREFLGAAANGKSDAEVAKLYNEKTLSLQADAKRAQSQGQILSKQMMKKEAETRDQRNAAMKGMTGKSVDELMKMSDAELEAFGAQMEAKYGEK